MSSAGERFKLDSYFEVIDRIASGKIGKPIPWTTFATPSTWLRIGGQAVDVYAIAFDTNKLPASVLLNDKRLEHDIQTALKERTKNKNLRFRWANSDGAAAVVDERRTDFPEIIPIPDPPAGGYMLPLGKNLMGNDRWESLLVTGSIIVAGMTRWGKTTGFFSWLLALIKQHGPGELQLAIVDGKEFEFNKFNGSPYLPDFMNGKVAQSVKEAEFVTANLWRIVKERRKLFNEHQVYSMEGLYKKTGTKLPLIVLFIDEYSVLIDDGFNDFYFRKLLKQGVGLGIISIVGTQRADADTIKQTNFATKISYHMNNVYESQVVFNNHKPYYTLEHCGKGELVALGPGLNYEHLKGYYVDKDEDSFVGGGDRVVVGAMIDQDNESDEETAESQAGPDPLEMRQLAYQVAHDRGIVHLKKTFSIGPKKAERLQAAAAEFLDELMEMGFKVCPVE